MNYETTTSWPFKVDHVSAWAYMESAFTKEECQKIIEIGEEKKLHIATTRGQVDDIRDSKVVWLYPNVELEWVYRKMVDIVTHLNDQFFKFDLFGFTEGFQFTKYESPGGHYGKHIDSANNFITRKLSFSLQLSSQEDYEGGDLNLHFGDTPETMSKKQGSIALFPSYVLHEVLPVTKGTRYSLVSWVAGAPFR